MVPLTRFWKTLAWLGTLTFSLVWCETLASTGVADKPTVTFKWVDALHAKSFKVPKGEDGLGVLDSAVGGHADRFIKRDIEQLDFFIDFECRFLLTERLCKEDGDTFIHHAGRGIKRNQFTPIVAM